MVPIKYKRRAETSTNGRLWDGCLMVRRLPSLTLKMVENCCVSIKEFHLYQELATI